MSDLKPLIQPRTATAEGPRPASVPLAIAPRAPSGDGLVAGGWDEDPHAAIHGRSLDALLAAGAPVAFVLGARSGSGGALPPAVPIAGTQADALGDNAVRPLLLGNSALLVEVEPTLASR